MKTITLTRENIRALSTHPSGQGFNRAQCEMMGFMWPPQKGWIRKVYAMAGTTVSRDQYDSIYHAGDELRRLNLEKAAARPKVQSFGWNAANAPEPRFSTADFITK